ncbi:MAG: hypothetical protein AB7L84_01900 [Acidimicrobiia bacterium]
MAALALSTVGLASAGPASAASETKPCRAGKGQSACISKYAQMCITAGGSVSEPEFDHQNDWTAYVTCTA